MNKENCLSCILNAIVVLQINASKIDCDDNSCTRPFLGESPVNICFNTRPITFYRCDNTLVSLPYTTDTGVEDTTVFRIENVNGNSVKVRLLIDNGDGTYTNTNTFATINLGCICAIRCLQDVNLTNI